MSRRAWMPSISAPAAADEASQARAMLPARTASLRMATAFCASCAALTSNAWALLSSSGGTIASDTIALSANGHYAFTLVSDRYPGTAGIRGTIQFDTPAGAQIGALGIRIPSVAAHTYTTLPALAK